MLTAALQHPLLSRVLLTVDGMQEKKWEVKFAPQLATSSRRTKVQISSDVQKLMDRVNVNNMNQLRTAMGGGSNAQKVRLPLATLSSSHE